MSDKDVERRLFERNDTFRTVRLLSTVGDTEGVVEDFSIGGMGIRIEGLVPSEKTPATIIFPGFGGVLAEVMHTTGNQVGLKFTDTPERIGELMHAVKNYSSLG